MNQELISIRKLYGLVHVGLDVSTVVSEQLRTGSEGSCCYLITRVFIHLSIDIW